MKQGKVRPVPEFFADFEAEHGYLVNIYSRAQRDLTPIYTKISTNDSSAALKRVSLFEASDS